MTELNKTIKSIRSLLDESKPKKVCACGKPLKDSKAKLCLSCQRKLNHKRRKAQEARRLIKQQEERLRKLADEMPHQKQRWREYSKSWEAH